VADRICIKGGNSTLLTVIGTLCLLHGAGAFASGMSVTAPSPFDQEQILTPGTLHVYRGHITSSLAVMTKPLVIPAGYRIKPGQNLDLSILKQLPEPGDGFALKVRIKSDIGGSRLFQTGWYPIDDPNTLVKIGIPTLSECNKTSVSLPLQIKVVSHINYRLDRESSPFLRLLKLRIPPVVLLSCSEERKN